MKQKATKWTGAVMAFLLVTCLFLFFYTGWLTEYPSSWDTESEGYVIGRMYQMQLSQTEGTAGFMGLYRDEVNHYTTAQLFLQDAPVTQDIFWTYTHQSGLQGTAAGVINLVLCMLRQPPQVRLGVLTFLNSWLFCLLFVALALWVYKELGACAALLCCGGTLFSPWALRSMGNLYWVVWLYLLTPVLCAWLCKRYETAQRLPKWAYALIAGSVFLRFLCGFEFTSFILISTEVPALFYLCKHWCGKDAAETAAQRRKWLMTAVWVGVWCLAAFAAAMLVLGVQSLLYWGDFARAVEEIGRTISVRTGAFSESFDAPGIYGESLAVPLGQVIGSYFTQETVTAGLTMGAFTAVYAVWSAVGGAAFAVRRRKALLWRTLQLLLVNLVSMLGPVSWFVLARGHSSIHVGINMILWLLPTLPLMLAHMGWTAQQLLHLSEKGAAKP